MGRAPGIRDVALEAGVSHQTVSRVLNDHPNVKAATRIRVVQAMQRLHYVAHNGARSMRSQRTRVVGVLVSADSHNVAPAFLPALEAEVRRQGMWMLLAFTSPHEDSDHGTRRLHAAAVDGSVVVSAALHTDIADACSSHDAPVLSVNLARATWSSPSGLALVAERTVAVLLSMIEDAVRNGSEARRGT